MRKPATIGRRVPDSYFELVKKFPLVPIADVAHLTEAQPVLDRLLREHLDTGGQANLEVLTDLVESYEDEHHEIEDASEASVLRSAHGIEPSFAGGSVSPSRNIGFDDLRGLE